MSDISEQVNEARNCLEDALYETDRPGKTRELLRGFGQLASIQKRMLEDSPERVLVENLIPTYIREYVRKYDRFHSDVESAVHIAGVLVLTEDYMEESINKGDEDLKEHYRFLKAEFDRLRTFMKEKKINQAKLCALFATKAA